jgi:2-polyprenyl-6-methoxyphenol hydroxylase-like FAD-dependent oxidoreductase
MKILVVGAGPTGLTMALAARQRGIECRLVEKSLTPSRYSKALAVQARTLEVFDRLGLIQRILAAAQDVRGLTAHLAGNGIRFDFTGVHPRFPTVVSLPQADTERLLLEAGAAPERGVEFVGLEGDAARLGHTNGSEEIVTADWIIGCDGAHSTVRHALGAGFEGAQYPEQLILADCRIRGLEPARAHLFPASSGVTHAFFPLPEDRWRAISILAPDAAAAAPLSLEMFARPGLELYEPIWTSSFKISRRIAERYRFGRVVLVGDAAHIHSPVGGQGMNLGIQDAFALAAALVRGEEAVDHWTAERHAIGRKVLRATDFATRMATAQHGLMPLARGLGLRLVASLPPLFRRLERALAGLDYPALPD